MKITRIRNVKFPEYAHETDAGFDVFVPMFDEPFLEYLSLNGTSFYQEKKVIIVGPHERVKIPSGLKMDVPIGYCVQAGNRSSASYKKGLVVLGKYIDAGYQGEVHITLVNTSNETVWIHEGEKIIQMVIEELADPFMRRLQEISPEEYNAIEASPRGVKGFGSSGVA